jgi:hypothetical protein
LSLFCPRPGVCQVWKPFGHIFKAPTKVTRSLSTRTAVSHSYHTRQSRQAGGNAADGIQGPEVMVLRQVLRCLGQIVVPLLLLYITSEFHQEHPRRHRELPIDTSHVAR